MPRVRLSKLHPAQWHIRQNQARFTVLSCGRRFGKDVFQMNWIAEGGIEGLPVAFGAPTYKMLTENWRAMCDVLQPIVRRRDATEHRLELITGGVVDMWSLDRPDAIRGRKYARFALNEAAYAPDLMNTWEYIISPTLIDLHGKALFASTPNGRNGFYQLFTTGEDETRTDWQSFKYSTYANPTLDPAEVERMERSLPEAVARQEIHAEFIDDVGSVFRNVASQSVLEPLDGPEPGREYYLGVDWGKSIDFTVLSAWDDQKRQVYLDRFNRVDYVVQIDRIRALHKQFGFKAIIAEQNSVGEANIERMYRAKLPVQAFTTTNASKANVVEAFALALDYREVQLINDRTQINEMQSFEGSKTASGLTRYAAPEGMHDDTVMAAMFAFSVFTDLTEKPLHGSRTLPGI